MTDSPLARPLGRRAFISKSLAIVGVGAAMPAAFVRAVFAEEPLASTPGDGGRTLVIVQLAGGNDGLNTLIPYADGAYYDARPDLAINPEAALHLDDRVALHPNLGGLKGLFDDGRLAIVQGAGYPEPNRSHFRSMEIWHTASTATDVRNGWLGRLLDVTKEDLSALWRAANVGAAAPLSLASERSFVPSLASVPAYVVQTDPRLPMQADRRATDWGRMYALQASLGGALALVSDTGLQAYRSTVDLQADAGDYEPAVEYPESPLAQGLQTCAQLVASNLGTGVCYVTTGGFDSHANHVGAHPELLTGIDGALSAFQADIEAQDLGDRITLLMWTEFGRRVRENGSGGTDHGTAGPIWVLGSQVAGGLHGEPPPVGDLDGNGDLKFTTDFRSVYASVLEQWLGVDAAEVLEGVYPQLPLFA
jgi:uncharacterized protein (DUF1501 family)